MFIRSTGRWTLEEHKIFLEGLKLHGKGWKQIAMMIQSRTVVQIRTHAQKYFQKLAKAKNAHAPMAHGDMSRLARFGGGFASGLLGITMDFSIEMLNTARTQLMLATLDYFGERSLLTAEVTAAKVVVSGALA